MGTINPQAKVADIVSECNGQPLGGGGPWTIFNVAGITSGQIADKINEANAALQGWVGGGPTGSTDAVINEQTKRFEVTYGSARLGADLVGITITDGFNYNLGGLAVQRASAQMQAYTKFIDEHLKVAKDYIKMLHQWFWVFNPDLAQGTTETGTPVTYWNVAKARQG